MRFWAVFWLLIAAAIGTFTLVNWQVLTARTEVNLIVAQIVAPLGLVMIGAMAGLVLLFLLFLVWLETKALVQIGRPGGSIGELRTDLHQRLSAMQGDSTETMRNLVARLEHLEQVVRQESERTNRQVASHVDALDPELKRAH